MYNDFHPLIFYYLLFEIQITRVNKQVHLPVWLIFTSMKCGTLDMSLQHKTEMESMESLIHSFKYLWNIILGVKKKNKVLINKRTKKNLNPLLHLTNIQIRFQMSEVARLDVL